MSAVDYKIQHSLHWFQQVNFISGLFTKMFQWVCFLSPVPNRNFLANYTARIYFIFQLIDIKLGFTFAKKNCVKIEFGYSDNGTAGLNNQNISSICPWPKVQREPLWVLEVSLLCKSYHSSYLLLLKWHFKEPQKPLSLEINEVPTAWLIES